MRVFIFVIGAAWDSLPPSGPLKAFYLKSRGVAGVARRVRGAPRSKLARSGTLLSRALGFETQGTNGLGMYAVEACLKQYLRDSHLAHRREPAILAYPAYRAHEPHYSKPTRRIVCS